MVVDFGLQATLMMASIIFDTEIPDDATNFWKSLRTILSR